MTEDTKSKSQSRLAKEEKVERLAENFAKVKTLVFWDYSGLTVAQMQNLRRQLLQFGSKVTVAKNTLTALALKDSNLKLDNPKLLEGPTAALVADDEIDSLKVLSNFIKNTGTGSIKFGFLDRKLVDTSQLEYLGFLPSKEAILGQIVNTLNSPIYNLINVLQGNLRNLTYVLGTRT